MIIMPDKMIETINISTSKKCQMIDITGEVKRVLSSSGIFEGICQIFVPHTTAAVTINENADPDVVSDMIMGLNDIVDEGLPYRHSEGNSTAHIKSSMIGCSESVIVSGGKPVLGTWQGIYFCEFDGPRNRKIMIHI